MDMDFTERRQLVHRWCLISAFSIISARVCYALSSDPALRSTPLCFANPSPPSGWVKDFHLQVSVHTPHTPQPPFQAALVPHSLRGSSRCRHNLSMRHYQRLLPHWDTVDELLFITCRLHGNHPE